MSVATVRTETLTELWIHTGTACNLECPFCLEGSKPADTRLERVTLADVRPLLEEARALGVRQFSFTGGEPLIVKDIVKILGLALGIAPCLVLTNGTAPLIRRVHQLDALKAHAHPLSFRVSLDYADAERHDAGRGWGNFRRAVEGLVLLHQRGFAVSVARQTSLDEDSDAVAAAFRAIFVKQGLPAALPVVALPDYGLPGVAADGDGVNNSELAQRRSLHGAPKLMCLHSKMAVKREGALHVYPCPLVDDAERFDQGVTLADALAKDAPLTHARCRTCVKGAASWSAIERGIA